MRPMPMEPPVTRATLPWKQSKSSGTRSWLSSCLRQSASAHHSSAQRGVGCDDAEGAHESNSPTAGASEVMLACTAVTSWARRRWVVIVERVESVEGEGV